MGQDRNSPRFVQGFYFQGGVVSRGALLQYPGRLSSVRSGRPLCDMLSLYFVWANLPVREVYWYGVLFSIIWEGFPAKRGISLPRVPGFTCLPRVLNLLLRRPGRVPRRCLRALKGGLHRGDCSVHKHLSRLDMPVSLADWPARVCVPHAKVDQLQRARYSSPFNPTAVLRALAPLCPRRPSLASATALLSLLSSYLMFSSLKTIDNNSSVESESLPRLHKHHFPICSYIFIRSFAGGPLVSG